MFSRPSVPRGQHRIGDNRFVMVVAALFITALAAALVIGIRRAAEQKSRPVTLATAPMPDIADARWDPKWPALPQRGFPVRPLDQTRAAYAFAAKRPDVLRSIPCFCGCMRPGGHASNEDCYVSGRTSTGVPRWTNHGYT